jgi:hypothetical protein
MGQRVTGNSNKAIREKEESKYLIILIQSQQKQV